jgi:hypothetical protein
MGFDSNVIEVVGKRAARQKVTSFCRRVEKNREVCLKGDEGLNFKLDVGTLRLDQQVACQRYRQN